MNYPLKCILLAHNSSINFFLTATGYPLHLLKYLLLEKDPVTTTASTDTVTLSIDRTSWGGTSNVTVLRSTTLMVSMQGAMKKSPGPTGPLFVSFPRRNRTALSNSWTTLRQTIMLKGKVMVTSR